MKRKFVGLLMAIFIMMLTAVAVSAFSPRTSAPSGEAYWYNSSYNPYYSGYAGQCTWYAWGRAYEITGSRPTYSPVYGGGVYDACVNAGYSYGSTPAVGSIMCTDTHVAIVESISGDSMTLSEYNWAVKEGFSTATLSVSGSSAGNYRSGQRILGYIYLIDPNPIPPTVDEFYVSGATGSGFTVSANLGGGISSVWLNIYGPSGSNGYRVSASSGSFSHYIKYSDYGGYGKYSIHLYAENSSGEQVAKGLNNIYPSANLGDSFYAVLLNAKSWKPIGVDSDNFVRLGTEDGTAKYVWKFTKNSNGTYTIKSALNGKVLDIEGMLNENGAKLQVWEDQGNSNQRFMPLEQNGGYIIYPQHTLTRVLDFDGGITADGTKIQLWDRHDGENQIFAIYRGNEVQLTSPTLSVTAGSSTSNTTFNWSEVYGEKRYDVKIWNGTYWVGDTYHIEWGAKKPYSIKLPAGHYEAYVDAANELLCKMSNVVKFDVAEDSSDINIFSRRTVTDIGYDIHADIKYLNQSAVYAAALYSSDGKLLDVQTTPVANGATSADVAFVKQTGAAYVRVFLWDNLNSMHPLTESERINL